MQTNFTISPLGRALFATAFQSLFVRPPVHTASIIVVDVVSSRSTRIH